MTETDPAMQSRRLSVEAPENDDQAPLVVTAPVDAEEADVVKAGDPVSDADRQVLSRRATQWTETLTTLNPKSTDFENAINDVSNLGRKYFEQTATVNNRFLQSSLAVDSKNGNGNSAAVERQLVDLRREVEVLSPKSNSLVKNAFSWLPGANRIRNYFKKYESNQAQLNAIINGLASGQDGLYQDNAALTVERKKLWSDMGSLKKVAILLSQLDAAVVDKIQKARDDNDADMAAALEKEALFNIRQRRSDVATQATVTLQAYMSMGLIVTNNKQLIKGVDRARTTTLTALTTAIEVAKALEDQELVLNQIDAVNKATNNLIDRTSDMLRQNTARIQQQASTSGLSPETLSRAYDAIFTTLDNIDRFRIAANDSFAKSIDVLDAKMKETDKYIERVKTADDGMKSLSSGSSNTLEIE